ncbi:MAG: peptide chain release factor N(5)-glutamine methyltransferase [Eubacteriaceae bacterium]|jgi:release factor glutamine methyltransferase|nr:peptide chain release factor N(5)-glutamine methyltransferase [Eubacteriaceae bacterium]MDD4507384.1 peptide chain release factor N(5)-glutamine methyltransferase [Eubacteriaceae bacterium]
MAKTNIKMWMDKGTALLKDQAIPNPRFEAEVLLDGILHKGRAWLYAHGDALLSEAQEKQYQVWLQRRSLHEPFAVIVGYKEFMGITFKVTPDVLIPRPDTECVVESALALPLEKKAKVLDLCTGTGAIGIALGVLKPDWQITLSDISPQALKVAEGNAGLNHVKTRIVNSDLLDAFEKEDPFDLIISNPPYIPHGEILKLEPDVKDYEPWLALDGGETGFDFYNRLIPQAQSQLKKEGWLVLECGADQAEALIEKVERSGFESGTIIKDLSGKNRGITAKKQRI